jgi:shikimate dehydrogenase
MKRACVIGWPIAHSRSPIIHNYWLKTYGIDGAYAKEAVRAEDLEAFLASLEARGFAGCNVTVPHKERAFAVAEVKDASATAVGAANTIWLENGALCCANTDTYGFVANLDQQAPQWRAAPGGALLLGAGGAARAIVYGLLEAGKRDVLIANRSLDRADDLARHFGAGVRSIAWDDRNMHVAEASLIINATTLGMSGAASPDIDFGLARKDVIAADIVYVPLETSFLKSARSHSLIGVDGLGMLLHQAVPGFEKWFGVRPDVSRELYDLVAKDISGA